MSGPPPNRPTDCRLCMYCEEGNLHVGMNTMYLCGHPGMPQKLVLGGYTRKDQIEVPDWCPIPKTISGG